jgi:hypothetical protein
LYGGTIVVDDITGADWDQKAAAAIEFIKDTKTLRIKASHRFEKASIPLKMYLKSLAILEKASIYLKKASKIIEIFIKAPHF